MLVGGEWPKESWPFPASLNQSRRRAGPNAGLAPSRSVEWEKTPNTNHSEPKTINIVKHCSPPTTRHLSLQHVILSPDRSAPSGLGLWGEKRRGYTATSAVARNPANDGPCKGKMKIGEEKNKTRRSRANSSKSTNGVADASEARLPLSSCNGVSLRANASGSGSPSSRRESYPRDYSPAQSEGMVEPGGGFHDGGGGFEVGEDALPEGWGQAVDERTGHVYYFCDDMCGSFRGFGRSSFCEKTTL